MRKARPGSAENLAHGHAVEEGLLPSHLTPWPAPAGGPQCLWPQGPVLQKTGFSQTGVGVAWGQFRHITFTVHFVLLLHQLLLRSSGIRSGGRGCCSVAKPRATLCDPMDCSTPGLPAPHHLPELAHTRVH